MEAGADTRHWLMVSCIRLPIVRSEQRTAVAAAVVLLLTVSTLPLHIGPKQFSNTLVMMILKPIVFQYFTTVMLCASCRIFKYVSLNMENV